MFNSFIVKKIRQIQVDSSNYERKSDQTCYKSDLAGLKSGADKLDIDKLENTPADLNKLRNIVKNGVVKLVKKSWC